MVKRQYYSYRPPKELLVGQGGPNFQCTFHHPLPGFCNILLEVIPEEVLCLRPLLPILLGFPIHAFPILVWYRCQGESVDDMMAVRGNVGIS